MLLYDSIKEYYAKDGKSTALLYMGKKYTYDELYANIELTARKLSAFVKEGDVATVCMPNTPEAVFCFYALNRLGAVVQMVHPLAPHNQLKKYMAATKSKLLVTLSINLEKYAPLAAEYPIISIHPALSLGKIKTFFFDRMVKPYKGDMTGITKLEDLRAGELPPPPKRGPETTGVYLHSGGTSGEPKIIELSDAAIMSLGNRGLEALVTDDARGMYMLATIPMSHGFGLTMCVQTTLTFGAVCVLMPKFDADEAVKLIAKNKLHFLVGVPNLYRALLKRKKFNGDILKNLYVGYIGGDVAPQALLDEFNGRLEKAGSKARLFEGYGLTETVNVCAVNTYKYNRRGSLGKMLSGLTAAVIDHETNKILPAGEKGELIVTGDTLMRGYLDDPDETAKVFVTIDGVKYVRTGDYGYMDEDGYLYFVQRLKRIIKISGISVFPKDIEASALELDGVTGACAVDYSDNGKTKIALYLTGAKQDVEKVKAKIATDLSHYAMPTLVKTIDEIPLTPIMKADTITLSKRALSDAREAGL